MLDLGSRRLRELCPCECPDPNQEETIRSDRRSPSQVCETEIVQDEAIEANSPSLEHPRSERRNSVAPDCRASLPAHAAEF